MSSIRLMLFVILLSICSSGVFAQEPASSQNKELKSQSSVKKAEAVENVDGIWELSSYLGKKLMNEMGNRMNLETAKKEVPDKEIKTKRVKIAVGPFKIERIESIN